MNEKVLVVGALVVGGVAIAFMVNKNRQAALAQNAPGAPGYYAQNGGVLGSKLPVSSAAADNALSGVLASVGSGLGGLFHGSGFGTPAYGGNPGGINDPGLDVSSSIDYPGTDYSTLADNNAYDANYTPDDTSGYDFSYA